MKLFMSIQTGPQRKTPTWHVEKQKANFIRLLYKMKQETTKPETQTMTIWSVPG